MTSSSTSRARAPRPRGPRRRRVLLGIAALVVVVVVAVSAGTSVGTSVLWFDQLGYGGVYGKELAVKVVLFVGGFAVMAVPVAASMVLAHRTRPLYAPLPGPAGGLERYREGLEPLRRLVLAVLPALLGLFTGSVVSSRWQVVLLWWDRTPFPDQAPVLGHNIAFYVFTLPFLRLVVGVLTAVVLLAGITGVVTHALYGGLRLQGPGPRTTRAARVHLAVLAAVLLLAQGASYWLDRYATLTDHHAQFDGADYTDVHVVIVARAILALIAALCAVLFLLAAVRSGWRLPFAGLSLLVVSAIVIGGIAPAAVQQFRVAPNQLSLEREYIKDDITATRRAFGVDDVAVSTYDPTTTPRTGALASDADTTASIRVLDPSVVSPTFQQKEQVKTYYQFPATLDVDRYRIDGASQDTVLAVRELDQAHLPNKTWVNEHTVFTHGYGVVAAAGNKQGSGGLPDFLERGIPQTGQLGVFNPDIYFGEDSPDYSIVGAPRGTAPVELDHPDDAASDAEEKNTYAASGKGSGGPSIGSWGARLLYALKFNDPNLVLSDAVNGKSQILYDRDPRDRVAKVAPYLTLDGDPYPAVIGSHVEWIVDGYTTSSEYPYSRAQSLGSTTADRLTRTAGGAVTPLPQRKVNYIQNSVKATVDAYTGKVTLYAWDASDPVLATWMKVFPHTVQPKSAMPRGLRDHVRYPEDLFKVQRAVLAQYHVTDPVTFYQRSDFWQVPEDPTTPSGQTQAPQPPYYLTLRMPGQASAAFSLTSTYIPVASRGATTRNLLTGFLAADGDAGAGYGKLRLLTPDAQVDGPGQVQNEIVSNTSVSDYVSLRRRGGSTKVLYGNLLTLPVGGGLLYVEPIYLQSSGSTSFPQLQKVVAVFGREVGFADTLDGALDQVFGGDSGASAGDAGSNTGAAPAPSGTPSGSGTAPTAVPSAVAAAVAAAQQAFAQGQSALAKGDFTAYGQAQARLQAALAQAVAAEQAARAKAPSTSPTPSPTASPSARASASATTPPPAG